MKVGSLVECMKAANCYKYPNETFPIVGVIYTIRDIIEFPDDTPGIRLEEIINPENPCVYGLLFGHFECCFEIKYFRELQPPMDISELIEQSNLVL